MTSEADFNSFAKDIDQHMGAIRAILLLDCPLTSSDNIDADTAASISKAFEENIEGFNYDQSKNTADARFTVDNAMKNLCLDILNEATASEAPIMEYKIEGSHLPSIPQLLDLSRYLAHIALADSLLFLHLMYELIDVSTIDDGTNIFMYLEGTIPFLKGRFTYESPSAPAKLILLKICNTLLRRLSRVTHTLLAGKIHLFLSQILPSTDRSAINANGLVNNAHTTEIEEVKEDAVDTSGNSIDKIFYEKFWSLQQVFQNPTKAVDPNTWLQVHSTISLILKKFATIKCSVSDNPRVDYVNRVAEVDVQNPSEMTQNESDGCILTVKYLSSPRLLHLQLRDADFRRHILAQCLILLHAGVKKASARQDVFRIKQLSEAEDLRNQILASIAATPSGGRSFSETIRKVLEAEDDWSDWKLGGSKSFERPKVDVEEDPITSELSTWIGSNPRETLRVIMNPVIEEMDPEDMIEEQYKKKNEPVYRWEVLRLLAKDSLSVFATAVKSMTPGGGGPNLEVAARLMFPDEVPAAAAAETPTAEEAVLAGDSKGGLTTGVSENDNESFDKDKDARDGDDTKKGDDAIKEPRRVVRVLGRARADVSAASEAVDMDVDETVEGQEVRDDGTKGGESVVDEDGDEERKEADKDQVVDDTADVENTNPDSAANADVEGENDDEDGELKEEYSIPE